MPKPTLNRKNNYEVVCSGFTDIPPMSAQTPHNIETGSDVTISQVDNVTFSVRVPTDRLLRIRLLFWRVFVCDEVYCGVGGSQSSHNQLIPQRTIRMPVTFRRR